MNCRICQAPSIVIFNAKVLNKYFVNYHQCPSCDFIQTDEPYWLPEAYSNAITSLDIGLLFRNIQISNILKTTIDFFFNSKGRFLDYGGGYGLLVRQMRDKGYDFFRQDIFCDNIFSINFDITDLDENHNFELLTAFEVFEHIIDPLIEVQRMLSYSDSILFSTELQPHKNLTPNNWWYFIPQTGQHISIYSLNSLKRIAEKLNCNLYSDGIRFHLITKRTISPFMFYLTTRGKFAKVQSLFCKKESLLKKDVNIALSKLD